MFPFRELIRQQRLHCQGRWVIARCSLCSFKSTFHNASNRLSFFLVKRCFRSHRSSPNVTLMFLSLHQPVSVPSTRTNWMEGDGRSTPVPRCTTRSQTSTCSSCYLRPIRRRHTFVRTYVVRSQCSNLLEVSFLPFIRTFLLECRHCQLTVIIITEIVIFQKSTQLIITSLIPFSDPTNIIIKKITWTYVTSPLI